MAVADIPLVAVERSMGIVQDLLNVEIQIAAVRRVKGAQTSLIAGASQDKLKLVTVVVVD